ncbi:hypothetical protein CLHUN_01240 [Ruminiclostridium hungatei]|uniref:Uncharacterized protein n=1 Tax=Ruminiclostridium hungatei TaxID=48256 RepID=A0A1V4SQY9_RUMHU|nr:hypothetical protein [Ruminiclostridium hungatei]OPX46308.1 hypothetical protein CLHUN_01240 [Ruminiclostridium hungatei]
MVVLICLKELINSKSRVKVMIIYFSITGFVLLLAILINLELQPPNPLKALMSALKYLGLEGQE